MKKSVVSLRQKSDGLNSLEYKLISTKDEHLFTHVQVILCEYQCAKYIIHWIYTTLTNTQVHQMHTN